MNLRLNLEYWHTMTLDADQLLPIEDFSEIDSEAETHMAIFQSLRQSIADQESTRNRLTCRLEGMPAQIKTLRSKISSLQSMSKAHDKSIENLNEELGISTHNLQAIAELITSLQNEGQSKLSFMKSSLE